MLELAIHEKYLTRYPIDGEPEYSEILGQYRDNIVTWGLGKITTNRASDGVLTINIPRECNVPFEVTHCGLVMSKDEGSVTGYTPYISIHEDVYDDLIPDGLPNRTYLTVIDDSDIDNIVTEEHIHTWRSWVKNNYTVDYIDGIYYYLSYATTDKAAPLTGDELMIILSETPNGITLVDSVPAEIIQEEQS